MTVGEVITKAMQELEMASAAEPLQSDDQVYCLSAFNTYIDDMANDRALIYQVKRSEYDLTAGTASYTIGSGAVWNGFRPIEIYRAGFLNTDANPADPIETPVRVFSDEEWAAVPLKSLENTISYGLWYDSGVGTQTDPSKAWGTIYPYPIPSVDGQMVLYVPTPMSEVAETADGLATELIVPRGCKKMFITNLALEIADAFGITPSPNLLRRAGNSKRGIKKSNTKKIILGLPAGLARGRGGFNILTNR